MKEYLDDFKQKKEEGLLSESAYSTLLNHEYNTEEYIFDENQKISIIIPAYNQLELLKEAINSIFNQTYQNFEIILIDDASHDGTKEFYSNYPDNRLKYYRNHENLGVGLSRQKGYKLSRGDYIIFCDHDDYYIDNNYFNDIINIFKDEDINVILSESYKHYEEEDKYKYMDLNINGGKIDSIEYLKNFMLKYKKPTSLFPAAFRREMLIESNIKLSRIYDTSTYLRALMMGGETFINKKIIGIYRVHGGNSSFNLDSEFIIRNLEEKTKIYDYLKSHNTLPNLDEWYSKQIDITVSYFIKKVPDKNRTDDVLNWLYENASYDEYLKYKKRVIKTHILKLYYFNLRPNFGDLINEDILSSIFKLKFEFATFQNADLCSVGSILDKLITNSEIGDYDKQMQKKCDINKPFHIWGAGLMHNYENIPQNGVRPFVIHALRGEKTRKRLSEILGEDISCVLADPGILAPLLVEPSKKKYTIGLVPHYWDKQEEIFEKMLEHYPNSKIIDVQNRPEKVLKEISMCEYILSTSLHGLIVADSYGIPNCWCEISDKVWGKGFKFHDYFSSYGTDRECFDLRTGKIPEIEKDFKCNFKTIKQVHKKQKELLECFPFK